MKKLTALLLAGTMVLTLAACGGKKEPAPQESAAAPQPSAATEVNEPSTGEVAKPSSPIRYSLGSGSSGGNFYVVGGGIATVINNKLPDYFVVTSEETGGSTANLQMILDGEVSFGVTMTSSIKDAVENGNDKVRGMIPLYPSYLTIYSLASTGAKSLSDLNGKVVGLGSKGAAMDTVWREILPSMNITPKEIFNDGHGATATAVGDGKVDVAVLYSLPPFAAIAELEATNDLSFVGLTEEEQTTLCDTYSFYSPATMPAGSYKGVTEDLNVVSEWNMLVTSVDMPEEYVYLITKTLMESNADLVEIYKGLTYATPENTLNYNCPLHAGVVRYLEEVGVEVPAELIPAEYTK